MGKRLFIAVDIDEATRAQVEGISAGVREAIGAHTKASWVPSDRMHLTLHFLGNADAALEERMRGALERPISEAPFDVTFDRLGFFPERGSPRVLWLGIRDGLAPLRRIHAALAGRNSSCALSERETGAFTPHLTLARLRDRVPHAKLAGIARIPASAGPSRIDRVTLYESRLSPGGPTYVRLTAAQLTGSG